MREWLVPVLLAVAVFAPLVAGAPVAAQNETSNETVGDSGGVVYVNVTNETVYVKFGNLTVINFSTTLVNIGWFNSTHLACAYSCIYAYSIEGECDDIRVEVYDGTVLRYTAEFRPSANNTQLCPPDLRGVCYGVALFNVSGFQDDARVLVVNLDRNETEGPFVFRFPYEGPTLEGFAEFIPLIVPVGVLISLAGRLSMKNVGIGLFVYGLLTPALIVLGADIKNILLVSSLSIILGVVLIWFSNQ